MNDRLNPEKSLFDVHERIENIDETLEETQQVFGFLIDVFCAVINDETVNANLLCAGNCIALNKMIYGSTEDIRRMRKSLERVNQNVGILVEKTQGITV